LKSITSKKKFKSKHIVLFGVLCLFIIVIQAQIKPKQLRQEVLQSMNPVPAKQTKSKKSTPKINPIQSFTPLAPPINLLDNKGATIINMENCDLGSVNEILNPGLQVLSGNVRFRHDNARLYCDSAYFYQQKNLVTAFGHVRIVQGDTLFIFGDILYYDGNTKLARLRHRVRLENRKTTLTTDSLNFSRVTNLAYYYTGGKISDEVNDLTSIWGQYSTSTNESLFKTKVHLNNKDFILDADSLRYNTKTNIARLISPTHILYNKETDIYSNRGWYNTSTGQSMLLNRSRVIQKDGKSLVGDTIYYDKKQKYGEGFMNVELKDPVQKTTLYGNYCYYNEITKNGLATDSALLIDWSGKDSMMVHADTLRTYKDSIYNVALGYYHVRFFRNDVQGLCDSLTYSARDSVLNMIGTPVLWADNNQLSGDHIKAFTENKKVRKIQIERLAVAIQKIDSLYFNQLSGKEIIAYVDSGQLRKVNVNGNAETLYYPQDDKDSTLIGLNKTQSSFVTMHFKNKKIDRVLLTTSTTGIMYPMYKLTKKEMYLNSYFWVAEQRPKNKQDLFVAYPKIVRPKASGIDVLNSNTDSNTAPNSPATNNGIQPPINNRTNSSPNGNNKLMQKNQLIR